MCILSFVLVCVFFFFKQKTAYEMRISDWSSDVCSSDLHALPQAQNPAFAPDEDKPHGGQRQRQETGQQVEVISRKQPRRGDGERSEEHTSELQSLMRISYAVF